MKKLKVTLEIVDGATTEKKVSFDFEPVILEKLERIQNLSDYREIGDVVITELAFLLKKF